MSNEKKVRRLVDARDTIESEARRCQQTQSWNPSATRSGWYAELFALVNAIDALPEDPDDSDLDEVIEALSNAEQRAQALAESVAEDEADKLVEELGDADAEDLEEMLARGASDGDRGASIERREDGSIVVTGWAMVRCVMHESGIVVGSSDEAVECEVVVDLVPKEQGHDEQRN